MAGLVQRFKRHAVTQRGVTNNGHNLLIAALYVTGGSKAQGARYRRGAVPYSKSVIRTFVFIRESAYSSQLPLRPERVPPAGKYLMGIGLVAHVPYYLILRRI